MLTLIPTAYAQIATGPSIADLEQLQPGDVITLLAALAIGGIFLLSIIFIFYGGFTFILSGGDEGKVKEAIHTIRYAIIGLIMALLSFMIVKFIGSLFGINFEIFDFNAIWTKLQFITEHLKSTSGSLSGAATVTSRAGDVPVSELLQPQ